MAALDPPQRQPRSAAVRWGLGGSRLTRVAVGTVLPLMILLLWQFWAPHVFTSFQLPSPAKVVQGATTYIFGPRNGVQYSGTFLADLWASLQRVLGGFLVGALIGVPVGLAVGFSRMAAAFLEPMMGLLRSVPGICWLPLALIWFGFGTPSAVFLISLGSFFPIALSTIQGVRFIEPNLVRAARTLGASTFQAVRTVALPASIPSVLNGLRLGLAYSWIYMILGSSPA